MPTVLSCSISTVLTMVIRPMCAPSHVVAVAQKRVVVNVRRVRLFRSVAVRRVLHLPLGMETLPPVSFQRGANWAIGGGGPGTTLCYCSKAIAVGGNAIF